MSLNTPETRQRALAQRLAQGAELDLALLAGEFGVSTDTVRRDLIALEERHEEARTLAPQEAGLPWRPAQHVEVLIALIAEARLLAEAVVPPPPAG